MVRLFVEHAWVEFPVALRRGAHAGSARTGGVIDAGRGVITALRDVSFELREGDRLGLMGHNGAGKSTMLRMLAGAYPPTRGRMLSVGSVSTLLSATPGINLDGTGRENILICGLHLGMSRARIAAKMDEIIDFAELGDYVDLPVRIYSSGMVTRLGFSIATAVSPEILLLDEGLATGDAHFAHKAEAKMQELIANSAILVIASHSEALLANMCTRCLLLEHGAVIADGPAGSVLADYRESVVAAARQDDEDAMRRAYAMSTEMFKRGEKPPPALEEQSLRHALTVAPDDVVMLQRYLTVIAEQGKEAPAEAELRWLLAALNADRSRTDLRLRLAQRLANVAPGEVPEAVLQRAEAEAAPLGQLRAT